MEVRAKPFSVNATKHDSSGAEVEWLLTKPINLSMVVVDWISDANAGNRRISMQIEDSAGIALYHFVCKYTHPASQRKYLQIGSFNGTTTYVDTIQAYGYSETFDCFPSGGLNIPKGATIKVYDLGETSSADTFDTIFWFTELSA